MPRSDDWAKNLKALLGPKLLLDAPLGALTTYRSGGPARAFLTLNSMAEIEEVALALTKVSIPELLILGNGSNLLVSDNGFNGFVVKLSSSFGDFVTSEGHCLIPGGMDLPVASRRLAALGLSGFEWAVGVPGTMGGAVRMNAGGHGSSVERTISEASVFDFRSLELKRLGTPELDFSYRHSGLTKFQIVLAAKVSVAQSDPKVCKEKLSEIVAWRRANQPGGQNSGSVFKNPPLMPAAALIESAGLKGLRVGKAEVSTRHSNFIQLEKGGLSKDVLAVMAGVKTRVFETTGEVLRPEVILVGFSLEEYAVFL